MSAQPRWPAHQQAMLREMGLRMWLPQLADAAVAAPEHAPLPAAIPAAIPAATGAPAPAPNRATATPLAATPATPVVRAPAVAEPALPTPLPGHLDHLDAPALRAAAQACQACGLCRSRRQAILGAGPMPAACMVVGDPSGTEEDTTGEPFAGDAGRLLGRMLAAVGLSRQVGEPGEATYTTNIVKCHPPRDRVVSALELSQCLPFLQRQAALVKPRVILAMGRLAAQPMLGSQAPLGQLRGRIHDWHGVPLVATYHPSYLLRHPECKREAWEDLCLAAQVLDTTRPPGTA